MTNCLVPKIMQLHDAPFFAEIKIIPYPSHTQKLF